MWNMVINVLRDLGILTYIQMLVVGLVAIALYYRFIDRG